LDDTKLKLDEKEL